MYYESRFEFVASLKTADELLQDAIIKGYLENTDGKTLNFCVVAKARQDLISKKEGLQNRLKEADPAGVLIDIDNITPVLE